MAASDDPKFASLASFGPPKECDNTGVIGAASRSLIEGYLQVNVPKSVLKKFKEANHSEQAENDGGGAEAKENEEKGDDQDEQDEIGEAFYVNEDNEEFPYFW
eukprot:CAMPEP_0201595852 /NCGR_PEP_ID=MMETSP0190_2-20130828/192719_1 /ASSEMBLY_ACC=CAM_ASM_000263 /TAXON_ID=37353 /ORGANISM="Rosalina sp." /LENGTH=102 /DNA_ID=CAMNT_0048055987 /DNA_START=887 /DNA_END=1192 /DNA_ORIENTATION=-